ncbi:MAG: class I SAM-dependent methyltransferase [Acidobacteria bacterium]|nr:class I SAM-dependent methyltransferase [Acidobacteriota bacterium]
MIKRKIHFLSIGMLLVLSLISVAARAQERKPARPLPAERADILLMESRDKFEKPDEIIARMKLKDGDLVTDIGTGLDYYSLRLARQTGPHGSVFAVDIQQGMLDRLNARMKESGVRNIYPILGTEDDPMLPAGKIDWVLLVDAYHEFSKPKVMLEKILTSLAPGGKVALIEYRAEKMPDDFPIKLPRDHQMSAIDVLREWLTSGFELIEYHDFLPAQHFFIFRKAEVK